jgi:hypothetical protein
VTAVSTLTGVARSTIGRGLAEVEYGKDQIAARIRRPGGGRKPNPETEPGLLEALGDLVQSAIRGDPEAALLWFSKSQRHLVGRLLRRLGFSLQANSKTHEGTSHPDRNAQFESINAQVEAFQAAGQPAISVDTKKKGLVGDFKNAGRELRPKASLDRFGCTTSPFRNSAKWRPMGSTTSPRIPVGSISASPAIRLPSHSRASGAGSRNLARALIAMPSGLCRIQEFAWKSRH